MKKICFIIVSFLITVTAVAQYQYKGQTDKKGLPHGQGVMTWRDGSSFEGTFSKGEPLKGTFIKCNYGKKISKIVGSFTTKKHPKGQLLSSDVLEHGYVELIKFGKDGLMFKGYKKNGICEGEGECCYFRGDNGNLKMQIGKGPWHDDYLNGEGLVVTSEGMLRCTITNGKYQNRRFREYDEEARSLWQKYYPHFVFGQLCNFEYSLDDLKSTGLARVLTPKEPLKFVEMRDVRWSGEVRDGKIQGEGIGFVNVSGDYLLISGAFKDGILQEFGHFNYLKEKFFVEMGETHNGFTDFYVDGKYGFLNESVNKTIPAIYKKVLQPYNSEGYAVVVNDKDEEVKINQYGENIGYTEHQEQLFAEARRKAELEEQERQRKAAEEARQRAEQEEKARIAAANAEKRRIDEIRNAKEGDRIVYCEDWVHTETNTFLWFTLSERRDAYTMKVICFVEKNVDNGERLQVRVGAVESSDKRYYNTPIIEGIRYEKGDVIWIRPLENTGWWME